MYTSGAFGLVHLLRADGMLPKVLCQRPSPEVYGVHETISSMTGGHPMSPEVGTTLTTVKECAGTKSE